jgi:uncharacterized LabA/DUF88 family protein
MATQALFVDLPNFYSRLLSSDHGDPQLLKDYFLHWFDFDRLAQKLTGEFSPVWVFYSGRRFGPSSHRIQDQYLDDYITRINSLKGVTARDVNIPGQQREPASYECDQCGHIGIAQWESEKGIDTSLTVYLFDTMEAWDIAYLLSGDADFVPAVASLRRRGKIVIGVGFSNASSALVRECCDYIDMCKSFLRDDFAAYEIFRKDGIVSKWLTEEVVSRSNSDLSQPIELSFEWQQYSARPYLGKPSRLFSIDEVNDKGPYYPVYLTVQGSIDLSNRDKRIKEFQTRFPKHIQEMDLARGQYEFIVSPLAWNGVERRLEAFISSFGGLRVWEARSSGKGYTLHYQYNSSSGRYEVVSTNEGEDIM